MTEAMPFLQKTILLSYDPRPFCGDFLFWRKVRTSVRIITNIEARRLFQVRAGVRFISSPFSSNSMKSALISLQVFPSNICISTQAGITKVE